MKQASKRQGSRTDNVLLPQEAALSTNSRLRLWWLERLRGYQVTSVVEAPGRRFFGLLPAERIWWLKEEDAEKQEKG